MNPIRGVLFDLGGTLLEYHREEVYRALLAEKGLDISSKAIEEAYRLAEPAWNAYKASLTSEGTWAVEVSTLDKIVIQQLGIENDVDNIAQYVAQNWMRMDRSLPQTMVRKAFPDVRPCLEALMSLWARMGVVSNIPSAETLDEEIDLIGLREFFPVRVASGHVGVQKPSLAIFHFAANQLQLNPRETMFVGDDYERDFLGSRSAGMNPVLIDRKSLYQHTRGTVSVSSLTEIPSMVLQSRKLT